MVLQATIDMLVGMKMTAMAAELSSQLQDSSFNELGFEDRLGLLVTAEWNRRQTNTVKRLIHNAHFAAPFAAVEEISYYEDRKLDKAQMLRFSTCKFVDEGHHIILKGASGNGKTYIACALGNAACRRFKKVRYVRMPELLDELSIARSGGELKKCLTSYKKVDLLILDEWLIRPLSPQESYDLLEIAEARCQRSMIFCTQYQSEGWYTRIDPNPDSGSPVSEAIKRPEVKFFAPWCLMASSCIFRALARSLGRMFSLWFVLSSTICVMACSSVRLRMMHGMSA